MLQQPLWKTEAGPTLVAEVGSVRLVVRSAGGYARFLVLRPAPAPETGLKTLVASGTESNVAKAMTAAEQWLDRFEPASTKPSRIS